MIYFLLIKSIEIFKFYRNLSRESKNNFLYYLFRHCRSMTIFNHIATLTHETVETRIKASNSNP